MIVFTRLRRDLRRLCRTVETVRREAPPFDATFLELVLILEDKRFLCHPGVDFVAAARATTNALIGRRRGGASTIDMQLVRTVTGYRAKTFTRKVYECTLAILARRKLPPEGILQAYLTIAFFGTGVIGANSAAVRLFNHGINDATLDEEAFVAAMLVYPISKDPTPVWHERVCWRAKYGLAKRETLGRRDLNWKEQTLGELLNFKIEHCAKPIEIKPAAGYLLNTGD